MYAYQELSYKSKQKPKKKNLKTIQCCKHDINCPYKDPCPVHEKTHAARWRKKASDSEGESENDDPLVLSRSLRPDESPYTDGITVRDSASPSVSVSAHINSGTSAKTKSKFISASRSIKVPGAWAGSRGRVARFNLPSSVIAYDFTQDPPPISLGVTALNAARASQEVVIDGTVPPESVLEVCKVHVVSKAVYESLHVGDSYDGSQIMHMYRTRKRSSGPVRNYILTLIPREA